MRAGWGDDGRERKEWALMDANEGKFNLTISFHSLKASDALSCFHRKANLTTMNYVWRGQQHESYFDIFKSSREGLENLWSRMWSEKRSIHWQQHKYFCRIILMRLPLDIVINFESTGILTCCMSPPSRATFSFRSLKRCGKNKSRMFCHYQRQPL